MKYSIVFADSFNPKSLRKFSHETLNDIEEMINLKLSHDPYSYGKPLRFHLKGCRRLRIGVFRVIYQIQESTVIILDIGHRSEIYE